MLQFWAECTLKHSSKYEFISANILILKETFLPLTINFLTLING